MNTFVLDLPGSYKIGTFEIRNGQYITFEDYLKLDVEGVYLEWVDGKVIGFQVNNLTHQEIIGFLIKVIGFFAEVHDLGKIIQAGYAMKLEELKRGREPDLIFVSNENLERLTYNYLNGAADIAVEIVSPESIERDTKTKFDEYQKAGVREYWLIDPQEQRAEFYLLNDEGIYQAADLIDGMFYSEVLHGFVLRVDWLWQENVPTIAALKELNLI